MSMEQIAESNRRFGMLARVSGMPLITCDTHTLMQFLPGKGTQQAYDAALNFVGVVDGKPTREHQFLTLVGEPGRGKTHLALGIGWQWLAQDNDFVKYWQVSELLSAMRAEFDSKPKDDYGTPLRGQLELCQAAGLLILDDLGVEKSTIWNIDILDTLINHRWLEQKPTVFTTNMAPGQLHPRIRSRIKEGVVVTLEGIDYREHKAKVRRNSEAK